MVVPGHGRLSDEQDVIEYRDMATIVRDRIREYVKRGMTLEQVKAKKPTLDFDPRYGWTPASGRRRCSSRPSTRRWSKRIRRRRRRATSAIAAISRRGAGNEGGCDGRRCEGARVAVLP